MWVCRKCVITFFSIHKVNQLSICFAPTPSKMYLMVCCNILFTIWTSCIQPFSNVYKSVCQVWVVALQRTAVKRGGFQTRLAFWASAATRDTLSKISTCAHHFQQPTWALPAASVPVLVNIELKLNMVVSWVWWKPTYMHIDSQARQKHAAEWSVFTLLLN